MVARLLMLVGCCECSSLHEVRQGYTFTNTSLLFKAVEQHTNKCDCLLWVIGKDVGGKEINAIILVYTL